MKIKVKNNNENNNITKARERSDRAGGRVWEGGPPSHGREIFQFWGSESCNLVHSLVRFLAFYEVSTYCSVFSVP